MVTGMVTEEAHVVLQVISLVTRVELLLSTSLLSGVLVVQGPLAVEVVAALSVLELPWSEEATLQQVGEHLTGLRIPMRVLVGCCTLC